MRSSFVLSASRTSIRFGGTDREAGQYRQYQLAPEVSRRSGGAKLPSSCWQGQQYLETRPWSPALWADYEATTAQGPNVSSRRLRTGAAGRVEMWRGCSRSGLSVAAPFVWRCPSNLAVAPFPHPAHRTGHADFPHPALGQDFTPSPTIGCGLLRSSARARSARKGARVDRPRPCVS